MVNAGPSASKHMDGGEEGEAGSRKDGRSPASEEYRKKARRRTQINISKSTSSL